MNWGCVGTQTEQGADEGSVTNIPRTGCPDLGRGQAGEDANNAAEFGRVANNRRFNVTGSFSLTTVGRRYGVSL